MTEGWAGWLGPVPMDYWLDEEQHRALTSSVFMRKYLARYGLRPYPRYTERSRAKPHVWRFADAKCVMRRLRRGRPVSSGLARRAMRTYWDEAKQAGHDEAWEDY